MTLSDPLLGFYCEVVRKALRQTNASTVLVHIWHYTRAQSTNMPPSSLSKARTYLSISLGKSTSWIANVKASRSSRPPPKACSRQVSTDETRKQVRTTMKRMAMMNKKALVIIDSSSSIAPRLICSTQVVKVALQDAIHHEEPRIRFSIVLYKS